MKKVLIMIVGLFLLVLVMTGCSSAKVSFIYHTNNDQTFDMITLEVDKLNTLELPTPEKEGYIFEGWFFDSEFENEFSLQNIDEGNYELYAKWSIQKYTITVHYNEELIEYKYNYNTAIELNALTKENCKFNGYYLDQELTIPFTFENMPAKDIDVYPKFIKNPNCYEVIYFVDSDKGCLIGDSSQVVLKNNRTSEVDVIAKDGYKFVGWDDGKTESVRSDVVSNDITYTATFIRIYKLFILNNNPDYGYLEGENLQYLTDGQESIEVKAVPKQGYKFDSWSNGSTNDTIKLTIKEDTTIYANFVIDYLELPVMEINTDDRLPIESKEEYLYCNVSISNSIEEYEFDSLGARIKGRGNSSWEMPKKSYKLKFNKKIDLFGNGKAKTWTLIANYCDKSLSRNYIAYEIGRLLESDYCTSTQFIDLYVNGEYLGVYLICEQNEIGETRVDIDESYSDSNTGYLLEINIRASDEGIENRDWFQLNDKKYFIKSPDTEDERFTEEFVTYIKNYLSNAYDAILSKNIDEIEHYIDLESFAKSYIVHEIMNCLDVGRLSFYLFKDKDGKLKSGPIWDFDISSGNYNYDIDYTNSSYTILWARTRNIWYNKLLEVEEFNKLVKELLIENYVDIIDKLYDSYGTVLSFNQSFNRNFEKWNIMGKKVWPNPPELIEITTWIGQIDYLKDWILKSIDYVYNYYVSAEELSYSIEFNNDENSSIIDYITDRYNNEVIILNQAWSRDLENGSFLNDGTGSVAFRIIISEGYELDSILINNPDICGELLVVDQDKHIYRINNISGNINISITTKEKTNS